MKQFPDLERIFVKPCWINADVMPSLPEPTVESTLPLWMPLLVLGSGTNSNGFQVLYMTPHSFIHCELEVI